MTLDPSEPPRKGRIILPGEPEPAPESPAVGHESAAEAPHIVLPPGVDAPEEILPEYPRLRPLEMIPVRDQERDYLVISDPMGVVPAPIALRLEVLELLQLLDGSLSLNELGALVARESKDIRAARFVRDLVSQLDHLLLLDSPRFHQALSEVRQAYHALEIRPAALEGISYPAEPVAARAFLDAQVEAARALAQDAPPPPGAQPPRAVVVPHLDPRRAGPTIALAWSELERVPKSDRPLRVVVFGVGHTLLGEPYALTRKSFETCLGKLPCDTAFVDALASRLGDEAYRGELAHRHEHSIELQALYLMHRFADRKLSLVPILVGGFHPLLETGQTPREAGALEPLIAAVRETTERLGGDTLYAAAVDFSHVGPRFGDPAPDERTRAEVEGLDRTSVEAARAGDAEAWYRSIADHKDSTRICGWGATYAMLRVAEPGSGRLLHYEATQEQDHSMVSIAAIAWP
jgi:MEMO1 family protein